MNDAVRNLTPLVAESLELEGVRSVGAVKGCQFTAGNGCEGPQPSTDHRCRQRMAIARRFPGGPLVGAVKCCQFT
ncbi:MAG TPA: hypothetical protein VF207_02475, partial [Chthoniobacterales bacterium]